MAVMSVLLRECLERQASVTNPRMMRRSLAALAFECLGDSHRLDRSRSEPLRTPFRGDRRGPRAEAAALSAGKPLIQANAAAIASSSVGSKRRPVGSPCSGTNVSTAPAAVGNHQWQAARGGLVDDEPPGLGRRGMNERAGMGVPAGEAVGLEESGPMDRVRHARFPHGRVDFAGRGTTAAEDEIPGFQRAGIASITGERMNQRGQIFFLRETADGKEIGRAGRPSRLFGSVPRRFGRGGERRRVDGVVPQRDAIGRQSQGNKVVTMARPADEARREPADARRFTASFHETRGWSMAWLSDINTEGR